MPRSPAARTFLLALSLAAAPGCFHGGPRGAPAAPPVIAEARAIVHRIIADHRLPGLAVTVRSDDGVLWREGFGAADRAGREPALPSTLFRVGSVSKLFTAAALLRLHDAGQVSLDAPARHYLPELSGPAGGASLRQLAHHTGGIRHYAGREFFSTTAYPTTRSALAIFSADTLLFPPGSRYGYSSYGYTMLGAVIEAVTGLEFTEALAALVLEPLGLRQSVPDRAGTAPPGRAELYEVPAGGGPPVPAPVDDLSSRWPSGGYLASTDNLAAFAAALRRPGFLSAESLSLLFTAARLPGGQSTGVGVGWRSSTDSTGVRYHHHAGSSNGGRAALVLLPEAGVIVAMASNAFSGWNEQDALAIARIFARSRAARP